MGFWREGSPIYFKDPLLCITNHLSISNPFDMKVQELTVGALVELVAVLLVGVQLESVGLGAG